METTLRTFVKALSWQLLGLCMITLISYRYTDSILSALSLASSSTITGLICFMIHEKIWLRIRWGKVGQ